jgi:hypothetical protein
VYQAVLAENYNLKAMTPFGLGFFLIEIAFLRFIQGKQSSLVVHHKNIAIFPRAIESIDCRREDY